MKPKITVKKIEANFELVGEKERIIVTVDANGRLTLLRPDGDSEFVFKKSDPGRVKRMGELFMKASEVSGYV